MAYSERGSMTRSRFDRASRIGVCRDADALNLVAGLRPFGTAEIPGITFAAYKLMKLCHPVAE